MLQNRKYLRMMNKMAKSEEITFLIKTIQENEPENYLYEVSYAELVNELMANTIEPKVNSYARQLKGDTDAGISEAYKLLMELVQNWTGEGNFLTLYKFSLDNRLKNLIEYLAKNKRKHNTSYDISLSESKSRYLDSTSQNNIPYDSSLITSFDITEDKTSKLEKLLTEFEEQYPKQSDLINIMLHKADDETKATEINRYKEYFGVDTYTPALQKQVSRARQSFKKYNKLHYA